MALPTSGNISLLDIKGEFGGDGALTSYYRGGAYVPNTPANAAVPTSGAISIRDFLGASSLTVNITNRTYESTPGGTPPGGQYAGYQLGTDGVVHLLKKATTGNPSDVTVADEWLIAGVVSDYEARADIVSGPTDIGTTLGTFGSWNPMGSSTNWQVRTTSTTPSQLVLTVSIRNATTLTVLDTATITLIAHIGN